MNLSKQHKYNKQRLIQSCVDNDRNKFDHYRILFNDDKVMINAIIISLRHCNIDLAEYIMGLYPELNLNKIFSYKGISSIKRVNLIKIIDSISKKDTPKLYKIKKIVIYESIDRFFRYKNLDELITCLNKLSSVDRNHKIEELLKGVSNDEMKNSLRIFMREDIINQILYT